MGPKKNHTLYRSRVQTAELQAYLAVSEPRAAEASQATKTEAGWEMHTGNQVSVEVTVKQRVHAHQKGTSPTHVLQDQMEMWVTL